MYGSVDELDGRIAGRLQTALAPGEEFVAAARCTDGLIDRWSTYLVVTSRRILAVRKVVFDSSVRGVKLSRLDGVHTDDTSLRLDHGLEREAYRLESAADAGELGEAIRRAREDEATASP